MSTTPSMGKIILTATLTSFLYSAPAYADSPGYLGRAEFRTPNQDKVVFLKTGDSQGMLVTTGFPNRTQMYKVITKGGPRLEVTVPTSFGERGGTYDETYAIKLRSSEEAQRLYEKLDFTKGRVASPAEQAEVALQALRRAGPYEVEGASTLAEREALERQLVKSASAIRSEGWGTYSGPRAQAAAGSTTVRTTAVETLEARVGSRAIVGEASAAQRLQVAAGAAEDVAAGRTITRVVAATRVVSTVAVEEAAALRGVGGAARVAGAAESSLLGEALFLVAADGFVAGATGQEPLVRVPVITDAAVITGIVVSHIAGTISEENKDCRPHGWLGCIREPQTNTRYKREQYALNPDWREKARETSIAVPAGMDYVPPNFNY